MKKNLLTAIILVGYIVNNTAQTFTLNPRTTNDTATCSGLNQYQVAITNNGSSDLYLSYAMISNSMPDTACWTQVVCDCNVCHPDNTIPTSDVCYSKITPSGTNASFFIYDVKDAMNHYGMGTLKYLIYETGNISNNDTLTFNIAGCLTGSACSVGMNDFNLENLTIYPSLANDKIYIKGDNNIGSLDGVKIYDMLGKAVYSQKNVDLSAGKKEISVSSLPSGIYFIELNKGAHYSTKKFVRVN